MLAIISHYLCCLTTYHVRIDMVLSDEGDEGSQTDENNTTLSHPSLRLPPQAFRSIEGGPTANIIG